MRALRVSEMVPLGSLESPLFQVRHGMRRLRRESAGSLLTRSDRGVRGVRARRAVTPGSSAPIGESFFRGAKITVGSPGPKPQHVNVRVADPRIVACLSLQVPLARAAPAAAPAPALGTPSPGTHASGSCPRPDRRAQATPARAASSCAAPAAKAWPLPARARQNA